MPDNNELFEAVYQLAQAHNISNLSAQSAPWVQVINGAWTIAVNGLSVSVDVQPTPSHMKITLRPYMIAVWCNGWLAGMFNPSVGGEFAAGDSASPKAFMAAIRAAIAKAREETRHGN